MKNWTTDNQLAYQFDTANTSHNLLFLVLNIKRQTALLITMMLARMVRLTLIYLIQTSHRSIPTHYD